MPSKALAQDSSVMIYDRWLLTISTPYEPLLQVVVLGSGT